MRSKTTRSVEAAPWFDAFCAEYLPRVRRFFVAMLGARDPLVDDLTSATFESLCKLEAANRIDPSRDLWPLVAVVARRRLIDHGRTVARQGIECEATVASTYADASASGEHIVDLRDGIQRSLSRLPPSYREALVLHGLCDLSHSDLAAITGRTPGSLRVLLTKARQRFRVHYEGEVVVAGVLGRNIGRLRRWVLRTTARLDLAAVADAIRWSARLPVEAAAVAVAVLLSVVPEPNPVPVPAPLLLVSPRSPAVASSAVTRSRDSVLSPSEEHREAPGADDRQPGRRFIVAADSPAPDLVGEPSGGGAVDAGSMEASVVVSATTPIGPADKSGKTGYRCDGDIAMPRHEVRVPGVGMAGVGC